MERYRSYGSREIFVLGKADSVSALIKQDQRYGNIHDGGQYDWQEGTLGQVNGGETSCAARYDHDSRDW